MKILGLDISTSVVGIAVVEITDNEIKRIALNHIDFKNCKSMWEKADRVFHIFSELAESNEYSKIDKIYVEDAAKRFTSGLSSADTLASLIRFNGLASYVIRSIYKIDPEYIAAGNARKLCGIKVQQKKKCGKNHKEQTFEYMSNNDLSDVVWPKKLRSEKIVDWSRDVTDAYVIAKAGAVLNIRS